VPQRNDGAGGEHVGAWQIVHNSPAATSLLLHTSKEGWQVALVPIDYELLDCYATLSIIVP
jgi:hypothetical protein